MEEAHFASAEDELEWWFGGREGEMGLHAQSYEPFSDGGGLPQFELRYTPQRLRTASRYRRIEPTIARLDPESLRFARLVYEPHRWPEALHTAFKPRRRHDVTKNYTLAGLALLAPAAVAARDMHFARCLQRALKKGLPHPALPTIAEFLVGHAMSTALRRIVLAQAEDLRDRALAAYAALRLAPDAPKEPVE
jgi:hypothetical protein